MTGLADWQLPPGVSRAVWDYAQDSTVAAGYDAELAGTPLLAADLDFTIRHLDTPCPVIDLGCGTGRVAVALESRGHRVVGIDLSESMLREARRKSATLPLARGNIVDLAMLRDCSFDAAVCLFSTLGMVDGVESRMAALREAARIVRPGGMLILHVHLVEHHLRTRHGRWVFARDLVRRMLGRGDAGDFPMPARAGSPAWTMHLFSRRELRQLLRRAGWVATEVMPIGIDGRRCRWPAYGLLVAARPAGV